VVHDDDANIATRPQYILEHPAKSFVVDIGPGATWFEE